MDQRLHFITGATARLHAARASTAMAWTGTPLSGPARRDQAMAKQCGYLIDIKNAGRIRRCLARASPVRVGSCWSGSRVVRWAGQYGASQPSLLTKPSCGLSG